MVEGAENLKVQKEEIDIFPEVEMFADPHVDDDALVEVGDEVAMKKWFNAGKFAQAVTESLLAAAAVGISVKEFFLPLYEDAASSVDNVDLKGTAKRVADELASQDYEEVAEQLQKMGGELSEFADRFLHLF